MTKKVLFLVILTVLRALPAWHSPEFFEFTYYRRKDRINKEGVILQTNVLYCTEWN
jgi:hypothetical protein